MKKKGLFNVVLLAVLLMIPSNAQAQVPVKLWIHGDYVSTDAYPYIEKGRTLVPLRVISESLGYGVNWDQVNRQVTVEKNGKAIRLIINSNQVLIKDGNGERTIAIDVAARISKDRTFVPLRAVAELFGETVNWDGRYRTAIVGEGYSADNSIEKITDDYVQGVKQELEKILHKQARISYDPYEFQFSIHPIGDMAEFYREIRFYPYLDDEYVDLWSEDMEAIRGISEVLTNETGIPFTVSINNPDGPDLMLISATAGVVDYNFLANPIIQ